MLVHGLWMAGWELWYLRRHLEACGYSCRLFHYSSVLRSPRANALRLARFLAALDTDVVHVVAHSLGGLVVLHLFEIDPDLPPGRVLMLGTPLRGSAAARRLEGIPVLRWLLGRSMAGGLQGDAPAWQGGRHLGMIAGTRGLGMGNLLLRSLESPNDGTVALAETRSPAVHDHLAVPYSHLGMLWSPRVAEAVCHYLREGGF